MQQRIFADPAAVTHHLHLHHLRAAGHAAQTMTINRKFHDGSGGSGGGHHQPSEITSIPPPFYGDDNPPPLPPLRNPQKALQQQLSSSTTVTTRGVESDACDTPVDRRIYIYSSAKYGSNGDKPSPSPALAGCNTNGSSTIKQQPHRELKDGKNPQTTTFCATAAPNSKPLPSIINCPLPDIPSKGVAGMEQGAVAKDDIYIKRKLLADHSNGGSKFATLKPIQAPKIEAQKLPHPAEPGKTYSNDTIRSLQQQATAVPDVIVEPLSPPPPPPLPFIPTTSADGCGGGGSAGSSGSSGYGTAAGGLMPCQIQALPLPPPPLEVFQQQSMDSDSSQLAAGLRLPPPPTNEELQQNGCTMLNGAGTNCQQTRTVGADPSCFYAVTEL
ncbi:uncharacterized protein LOC128271409 [Anopheles cruzii]|uniref:uncharacterized protein LOC128271409 n=1 Tax=Anopheles cruzii TaxID=68878 RepID=UPI0022EC1F1D|nr:uncharacterized protein LOC128271409 [Anopheles cruzii]